MLHFNTFEINLLIIQYIHCSMLTVLTVHDHCWTNWLTIHSNSSSSGKIPFNITLTYPSRNCDNLATIKANPVSN